MNTSTIILVIGIAVILLGLGIRELFTSLTEGRDDDMQKYLASQKRKEREVLSRTNRPKREPGLEGMLQSLNRSAGGLEEKIPRSIEELREKMPRSVDELREKMPQNIDELEKKMTPEGGMPWGKPLAIIIVLMVVITVIVNVASFIINTISDYDDSSISIDLFGDDTSDEAEFDDQGNLSRYTEKDWFGNIKSISEYYPDGNILRQEDYVSGKIWEAWEYADDDEGNITRYEDHTDSEATYCYDYDEDGNEISTEYYYENVLQETWEYERDDDGNMLKAVYSQFDYNGRLYEKDLYGVEGELLLRTEDYSGNDKMTGYQIMMYNLTVNDEDDSEDDILEQILQGSYEDTEYIDDIPILRAHFDADNNLEEVDILEDSYADDGSYTGDGYYTDDGYYAEDEFYADGEYYDYGKYYVDGEYYDTITDEYGTYIIQTDNDQLSKYEVEYGDDGFAVSVTYMGD